LLESSGDLYATVKTEASRVNMAHGHGEHPTRTGQLNAGFIPLRKCTEDSLIQGRHPQSTRRVHRVSLYGPRPPMTFSLPAIAEV
jgi:hypothetical protein